MKFKKLRESIIGTYFAKVQIFFNLLGVENLMKTMDVSPLKTVSMKFQFSKS